MKKVPEYVSLFPDPIIQIQFILCSKSYPIMPNIWKVPEYVSLFPDFTHGKKAEEGQFAYSKPFQVILTNRIHKFHDLIVYEQHFSC